MNTVFRGYIDDSGDQRQLFCLSCLLAKAGNWQWIIKDWNQCIAEKNKSLAEQDRTQILRYHSVDINNFAEEYNDWSSDERKEFSTKLLNILKKASNCATSYSRSIELKTLVRIIPETASNPKRFANAILLKLLMLDIGKSLANANKGNISLIKVALIHDRCAYNGALAQAFEQFRTNKTFKHRSMFATLAPMGWEDCVPLQPADLIAYENFKEALRQKSENEKDRNRARRIPLKELLSSDSLGGISKHIGEEGIRGLRKYLDNPTSKIVDAESK